MDSSTAPTVQVIIPTRGKLAFLKQALKTLFASIDESDAILDITVIEQSGPEAKALIESDYASKPIRWMEAADGLGFSAINNRAAATSTSDFILLLNNDVICRKNFLKEMLVAATSHPEVGIVGAKLLHLQNTIQHIGVIFQSTGIPSHLGYGRKDDGSYLPAMRDDYYDAVTFACALIRREVWNAVGGLHEAYFFNYEDVDFCLSARELGWRTMLAHKAVLVHLEGKSKDQRTDDKASLWRNLKILRDRWIYTRKVEKLCNMRLSLQSGQLRDDRLNIAFLPSSKGAGVPWWRIDLPARKIAKLGLANVEMIYVGMADDRIARVMENSHLLVTQGFWSEWVKNIANFGSSRPFGMIYDYDDHPIYISPFAEAYKTFGTREIRLQAANGDEAWLWRDGQNGFDLARNIENRQRQLEIFHLVDAVTTTTEPLRSYLSTINKDATILPNCIDFDIWRHNFTLWERASGPLRIGWHGGDNHYHDMATIGPWLTEFVNSHDVRLVLFGAFYRSCFKGIDLAKVEEHEWIGVDGFPAKLANLAIDIGIIPLADPAEPMMEAGAYKSNIKFLEYSALRIPSLVAAGRQPYHECYEGENALTYSTREEFLDKLFRLTQDAKLRRRLSTNALAFVHEHYDLEKNIHRWMELYSRISRGRPLAEAVQIAEDPIKTVPSEAAESAPDNVLRFPGSNSVAEGSPV